MFSESKSDKVNNNHSQLTQYIVSRSDKTILEIAKMLPLK